MKKEITLGQLLGVGVTLLIAIITAWVTLNNKVSEHDVEIKSLQSSQSRTDQKLDRIEGKVEQVLINMERKKDRD